MTLHRVARVRCQLLDVGQATHGCRFGLDLDRLHEGGRRQGSFVAARVQADTSVGLRVVAGRLEAVIAGQLVNELALVGFHYRKVKRLFL